MLDYQTKEKKINTLRMNKFLHKTYVE